MTRFSARNAVEAKFGAVELGEVSDLDVGEFDDPTKLGLQCYTFSCELRRGIVRFLARAAPYRLQASLAELVLSHQGAEYRALAVCTEEASHANGVRYQFEVEEDPRITAPARERHGVDCLATALLLDALAEDD